MGIDPATFAFLHSQIDRQPPQYLPLVHSSLRLALQLSQALQLESPLPAPLY